MKEITLPAARLGQLSGRINDLSGEELGSLPKEIRLADGIIRDLNEANKVLVGLVSDWFAKQMELANEFKEKFKKDSEGMEQDAKNELEKKMQNELDMQIANMNLKFPEEAKKIDEAGLVKIKAELSDEKHVKLKELWEKYGSKKMKEYTRPGYLEICDALGI